MLEPASADASFRRYFRLRGEESTIVMDAPPPQEDCRPFVQIAAYLEQMGLNSPRVLQADLERGFLLLTDLGSTLYLAELNENPLRADTLYGDAMDALLILQQQGSAFQSELPSYDAELLRFELSLFHDWLCERHLGISLSEREEKSWNACCEVLVENSLQQETVFVHRDYHSRNLMVTDKNNPGILDFQDAVEGPLTYDLVSLLKDCYVKWPEEQIERWALSFYDRLPNDLRNNLDAAAFIRQFDLTGVQ
ncbi:MAG: aminoglycoside phosphotransferase, partial [Gammaproteobacteria bacterium]